MTILEEQEYDEVFNEDPFTLEFASPSPPLWDDEEEYLEWLDEYYGRGWDGF